MILTKSQLTFGQITKIQLTRSYLPTDQALIYIPSSFPHVLSPPPVLDPFESIGIT